LLLAAAFQFPIVGKVLELMANVRSAKESVQVAVHLSCEASIHAHQCKRIFQVPVVEETKIGQVEGKAATVVHSKKQRRGDTCGAMIALSEVPDTNKCFCWMGLIGTVVHVLAVQLLVTIDGVFLMLWLNHANCQLNIWPIYLSF